MKKNTLILILVILPFLCLAQTTNWEHLHQQAAQYSKEGNFSEAIRYAEQAKDVAEKEFGKENGNYIASLNSLAKLYFTVGKYHEAESNSIELLGYYKKTKGINDPAYIIVLNNLASLYYTIEDFPKAKTLFAEVLSIRKKTLGKNHPDYARTLNDLGSLYFALGNYEQAEPLLREATVIRKTALGENSSGYANSLGNLAAFYGETGDYAKVEPLLLEVLTILRNLPGDNQSTIAHTLKNLADYYRRVGNYQKSGDLYMNALDIYKNSLGENNPEYATTLRGLGLVYKSTGNYKKAESIYLEAIDIQKKTNGENNTDYAISLINLATLYMAEGNNDKAESLIVSATNIIKNVLGENHPSYAGCLINLAAFYEAAGKYSKAEPLYNAALDIYKNSLGETNEDYTDCLNELAILQEELGNNSKAWLLLKMANDNINKLIKQNFSFMSESEKEIFIKTVENTFNAYNSFVLRNNIGDADLVTLTYNNELLHKGMLLLNNVLLRQNINNSDNSRLIDSYNSFIDIRKSISKQFSIPIANRKVNVDSLKFESDKLEKAIEEMVKGLPGIKNISGMPTIECNDVQRSLKPGEAAIEFVNFQNFAKRVKRTDSVFYCALILRKNDKFPKMIYLFEEKQLQQIISTQNTSTNANSILQIYGSKNGNTLNKLYRLIWEPIEIQLKDISTIYLAPSGLLNNVSFAAIPVNDSTYLIDKYKINIVSSTRVLTELDRHEQTKIENYNASLFGGIEYDVDSSEMISIVHKYQKQQNNYLTSRSLNILEVGTNISWPYLTGTLNEVNGIEKLLKSKSIRINLYSGKKATEEAFKQLGKDGKSPEVIHVATHGFFFPEIKTQISTTGDESLRGFKQQLNSNSAVESKQGVLPNTGNNINPLLRSGLLFAGANRMWKNIPAIYGVEDGTLTAYDVSNMNLFNTQLVVLSACETGLGDLKGSEGVYGLQRAFKMAGVHYIIMSLWQVPDNETSELMNIFYTNWLNGIPLREAFNKAQQNMRKKYDPYYWAAFELIE